jgi:hypothetical protein
LLEGYPDFLWVTLCGPTATRLTGDMIRPERAQSKNTKCFSCLLRENFATGCDFPEDNKKDGFCRHAIFKEFSIIHKKQKKARGSLDHPKKYTVIQLVILQPPAVIYV